jgi:hypothetical protein
VQQRHLSLSACHEVIKLCRLLLHAAVNAAKSVMLSWPGKFSWRARALQAEGQLLLVSWQWKEFTGTAGSQQLWGPIAAQLLRRTVGIFTAVAALVSPKCAAASAPYSGRPISRPDNTARIAAKTSTRSWYGMRLQNKTQQMPQ